ncbi:MAG: hypothetical protein A2494_00355 [Candidatus Lloydbacteria bacterium RIFOXYC12_FULL_46_25]|uniref:Uncharacterized protein n=1 Tax=Candidatus Lloydbacteria bacterium RIFOXYC12_FULL_46_25 TaxID=1798670 RepID=A0A1G2DV45_9BACT|nr:MAG: hypothetical protein A2494_00355 [Candidatus Lloydbacteria bacterium RIFOXYC12_FULL_46_25]
MKRPLIVTTCSNDAERYFLRRECVTALEQAGGTPLIIAASNTPSIQEICGIMEGLYLTGGDDIHPSFYGEAIAPHYVGTLDMSRDQLERELVIYAVEHHIPIFGICRGMQALNVFLGGALYQDIACEQKKAIEHRLTCADRAFLAHPIKVKEGTRISNIMGGRDFMVNSIHHQGVKELGKDLIATATSPDGLIEAIELPDHPFTIGVEWHPEELKDDASRQLFIEFVNAAKAPKEV